jgi:hypothetical protein
MPRVPHAVQVRRSGSRFAVSRLRYRVWRSAFDGQPPTANRQPLLYQHHDRLGIDLVMRTDDSFFLARFTEIVRRTQTRI